MKRNDPEQLKRKFVRAASQYRACGIGLSVLSLFAFLFSRGDAGWPLSALAFCSAVIFVIGLTLLFCGSHIAGILAVFGDMEPPPITLVQSETDEQPTAPASPPTTVAPTRHRPRLSSG